MAENSIDRSTAAPGDLAGRVAVVTGSGQGISLETARILAHLGAAVGILEISERGHEVAARITADGGTASAVTVDVADRGGAARGHRHGRRGGSAPWTSWSTTLRCSPSSR